MNLMRSKLSLCCYYCLIYLACLPDVCIAEGKVSTSQVSDFHSSTEKGSHKKLERYKRCSQSLTQFRGSTKKLCTGDIIFHENFKQLFNNLGEWQIEHRLPTEHPEYPFVSYQNLGTDPTVYVEDGYLKIVPRLLQSLPGFNNDSVYYETLDLTDKCTGSLDECYMVPTGSNILPPIVSGRLYIKDFGFKYGKVTVRAKLPLGDWLYPEILLEPLMYKYGRKNFASGVIKIASSHGNEVLNDGNIDYSNKVLYGGAFMDFKCYSMFLQSTKLSQGFWGDEFHNFTLIWEPESLTFIVDNEEWAKIDSRTALRDNFVRSQCTDTPQVLWSTGTNLTPFDEYFTLTLGLAAGGITDFKDGLTSERRSKPWKNFSSKSKLHFWQDIDSWYNSWNPNSILIVDDVKIIAI